MSWRPTFEELQEAIIAENTFGIPYVEAWALRVVCPPLLGQPDSPAGAFLAISQRDRWSPEGPSLLVDDEDGVELQRAADEAQVRRELDLTVREPGTDHLLFHWAQVGMKLLGRWVEPPADHYGSYWSAVRPQFWVWGAEPHAHTRRCLGVLPAQVGSSRMYRLWREIQLKKSADMFDAWLLREIRRTCES